MVFCAFLRGVNVNGTAMKMAEVCKVFEKAGMQKVSSVLATGNIIFSSDKNPEQLKETLEYSMSKYFDYECFMFLKISDDVRKICKNNPFEKSENHHIYIFVTSDGTEKLLLEEFEKSNKTADEKGKIVGNTFYWQVAKGSTLDSDFGKILAKKTLKDKITSRNLNTFEKVIKKL